MAAALITTRILLVQLLILALASILLKTSSSSSGTHLRRILDESLSSSTSAAAPTTTNNKIIINNNINNNNNNNNSNIYISSKNNNNNSPEKEVVWDCNRRWPQLELFLPVSGRVRSNDIDFYDYEVVFLRTLQIFWPLKVSNTSLLVLYDEEVEGNQYIRDFKGTFANKIPGGLKFAVIPPSPYYQKGSDRQQLYMFWADNFTSSEYVAFCDLDVAIVTYVDREDLFENGKPVVNARGGWHKHRDFVSEWANGTHYFLGYLEPFKCMSYFPIIFKTKHLKGLRDHVERHFGGNMYFDEIFRQMTYTLDYSQFNIMCTYMWNNHRDEYQWYVHSETPDWNGTYPEPHVGQDGNVSQFTEQMKRPKPRVATHTSYRKGKHTHPMLQWINGNKYRLNMNVFIQRGVCYSPPFPKKYDVCNEYNPEKYYLEMHQFEFVHYWNLNSEESLNREAKLRHDRIKHCHHEIDSFEEKICMKPLANMTDNGWSRRRSLGNQLN